MTPKIKIGDMIETKVILVEEGFALLEYHEYSATLMQTEITWKAGPVDTRDYVTLDSKKCVLVTAISDRRLSVSLKRVAESPWNTPPRIGDEFLAPVVLVAEYGYFVRITWFCDALLLQKGAKSKHRVNDKILVQVIELNIEHQKVTVRESCS